MNTALSFPDSSRITDEPGVCPAARSSFRPESRVYEPSHSFTRPASCTGSTLSSQTFWLPCQYFGRTGPAGFQKSNSIFGIR
jgi:hypothetical protein